ncbi:uncharacterized protein LOC120657289 isoform X3 [Panicum virgatum]|uniref:uncharacterized protein LOC120657289 isoform X3 n=1 Tax=Panicum virgatum TaxID=38727 RepID=UPI0019D65978|nr:uncharacterized protein LOC120657289 isoform X3 [Panicum virgatum]
MEGAIPKPSEKRVALVTGGNRGMGFEICWQLASSGLAVVLTARDERKGAEAAARLRRLGLPDVVFHQLDIAEPASAARLADFVRDKFGKLDVLVNNAGIMGVTMEVGDEAAVKEIVFGCINAAFRQGSERDCRMAEAADHAEHPARGGVPENQLPRHQKRHRSAAPTRPILRRRKDRQRDVSVRATQILQRRGAPAGAERHRHADEAAAGRAGGAVRGGPAARRAGAPRVAGRPGVRGVPGVQGARVRLHEDPRQGQRRAAGQLRAPGLRRDRDELQHGQPDRRGGRQRLRRGRARRAGRRHRRLL